MSEKDYPEILENNDMLMAYLKAVAGTLIQQEKVQLTFHEGIDKLFNLHLEGKLFQD